MTMEQKNTKHLWKLYKCCIWNAICCRTIFIIGIQHWLVSKEIKQTPKIKNIIWKVYVYSQSFLFCFVSQDSMNKRKWDRWGRKWHRWGKWHRRGKWDRWGGNMRSPLFWKRVASLLFVGIKAQRESKCSACILVSIENYVSSKSYVPLILPWIPIERKEGRKEGKQQT